MKRILFNQHWVRVWYSLLPMICLVTINGLAQKALPVIQASAPAVTVKDGYVIREGIWSLSPDSKPDIYYALKPITSKIITFYTDKDSISFNVRPGEKYDFIILLNNRDSCFTRISTQGMNKDSVEIPRFKGLIEPELLAMDFVVLRESLRKEHPGLYRYRSKEKLDRLLDSCLLSIDEPLTQLEFAKKVLFITSYLQDGHTGTNISSLLMTSYLEGTPLFPIYLYFVNDKAFVSCSKNNELPTGTQILSINNIPIDQIRRSLFRYLPSDGSIETKKFQTLNNNGAFPFLYNWIFGHYEKFVVKYMNSKGEIKKSMVAATLAKDFECEIDNGQPKTNALDLQYPKKGTAVLSIRTFDKNRIKRSGLEFESFVSKAFQEIAQKKIQNLIIDLRGNAGGEGIYGALLYSYIARAPFKYFAVVQKVDQIFTSLENPLLGIIEPKENSFKGKVIFLINGLSFSTTADFCAIAKSNARGKFIGEETGGGYYGNTSGQTIKVELPNSKVQIIIPKVKYVNDVKKVAYPDRGVIPDYHVNYSIKDLMERRDVQLQFAIGLIGN